MRERREYKGETLTKARVHEHAGRVAVLIGNTQTIYISTNLAFALGKQLTLAAKQIDQGYHYPSTEIGDYNG